MSRDEHKLEIAEVRKKEGVFLQQGHIVFILLIGVGIVVGVGLMCYYLPDRSNGQVVGFVPISMTTTTMTATTTTRTTEVATTPAGPWQGFLPRDVVPESYALFLKPYINEEDFAGTDKTRFNFDGEVTIRVVCHKATSRITVHSLDITVVSITVTSLMGDDIDNNDHIDEEYQFLHIDLANELVVGMTYDVTIVYIGQLNDKLAGFYRSSYTNPLGNVVWGATSQMQPTDARRALPCFDEPDFKAIFNTTIEHRSDMIAITNGIEIDEVDVGSDWKRTTYKPTPPMSTYLLAFTVGKFEYKENTTTRGVRFRVWSRPEFIDHVDYALYAGSSILSYFEEYFERNFPLEKQDMIAVPEFSAGAMENWGLIIYRESALLYNPDVSSASNKQRVANIVSHELAHQWFGNLVTPKWWDDLWLNEGFATYAAPLGVHHIEPEWGMLQQFVVDSVHSALDLDSLGSSHPVRVPVGAPAEINQIFDTISYAKGGSILRMLNNILSEEVFRRGLADYLRTFEFGNADTFDLWNSLAESTVSGLNVTAVMNTWTLQMGYPLVSIKREGDELTAIQKYYLSNPSEGVDDRYMDLGYKWYVYMQYTHASHGDFDNPLSVWMNATDSVEFSLYSAPPTDWYLVNTYQYGYYRVNYDDENWSRLINQLVADHTVFPPENRAQMIDDALTLASTGNLSHDIALGLTSYLEQERHWLPWEATFDYTNYIARMFRWSGGFGKLELYIQQLVKPLYDYYGWPDRDNVLEQYTINDAISQACYFGLEDCLTRASNLFKTYMQNSTVNPISNNLRTIVYCNGIREGGQVEWNFGWNQYLNASDSVEKNKWISALGCSRQPWILNRYLLLMIEEDSKIRAQDARSVIWSVASNHVGVTIVWDFVRANWDAIYDLFVESIFAFSSVISTVTQNFNTQQELDELLAFREGRDFASASRAYEQAIEKTKTNMRWMNDYEDIITQWLSDRVDNN